MKLSLRCCIGMALVVAGCSDIPKNAPATTSAPRPTANGPNESSLTRGERITAMLANESFGPLRLNQPQNEVLQILGEPGQRGPITHIEATGLDVQDWSYPKSGLILRMASSAGKSGPKFLAAIYAKAKCTFATRRGIHLGSTQAEAQNAYAGTEDPQEHEFHGPSDAHLIVGSIFGGIVFEFTRGKVTGIFYGAYAECRTIPGMAANR